MVSIPTGVPVRFRKKRITVSPPVNALALPSEVLLFFFILLMVALVATPPFREKVNEKSLASKHRFHHWCYNHQLKGSGLHKCYH